MEVLPWTPPPVQSASVLRNDDSQLLHSTQEESYIVVEPVALNFDGISMEPESFVLDPSTIVDNYFGDDDGEEEDESWHCVRRTEVDLTDSVDFDTTPAF
jgi:hypothetical protein